MLDQKHYPFDIGSIIRERDRLAPYMYIVMEYRYAFDTVYMLLADVLTLEDVYGLYNPVDFELVD